MNILGGASEGEITTSLCDISMMTFTGLLSVGTELTKSWSLQNHRLLDGVTYMIQPCLFSL